MRAPRRLLQRLAQQHGRAFSHASQLPAGPLASDALFAPPVAQHRLERIRSALRQSESQAAGGIEPVQPQIAALLVDAAGTLIEPSEPAAAVYLRHAARYGCTLTEREILVNFRRAYQRPWTEGTLRYVGDARDFWRRIVAESTQCDDEEMHEALYTYFAQPAAWRVAPGAREALQQLRDAGLKLAVVSNFDTRLRPILEQLGLASLFHAMLISAEVGLEKPNPAIFEAALQALRVPAVQALVLGDDRRNDVSGGRSAGCSAWLYGVDVADFGEAAQRLLAGKIF